MSDDVVRVVKEGFAAFSRRDREAMFALLGPGFVADFSRSVGPERGLYEGPKGLGKLLDAYWGAMETFEVIPAEVRDLGDGRVLVLTEGRGIGKLSGAEVRARGAHLFRVTDGCIVHWSIHQTAEAALGEGE